MKDYTSMAGNELEQELDRLVLEDTTNKEIIAEIEIVVHELASRVVQGLKRNASDPSAISKLHQYQERISHANIGKRATASTVDTADMMHQMVCSDLRMVPFTEPDADRRRSPYKRNILLDTDTPSAKWLPFDRIVHLAVGALYMEGQRFIYPKMVYNKFTLLTSAPSRHIEQMILDSMEKLSGMRVTIYTEPIDSDPQTTELISRALSISARNLKEVQRRENVLLAIRETVFYNGKEIVGYELFAPPVLYTRMNVNQQLAEVPSVLLRADGKLTEEGILIRYELIREIHKAAESHLDELNIEINPFLTTCGIKPDGPHRNRNVLLICGALDIFQAETFVGSYQQCKKGRSISNITIKLTEKSSLKSKTWHTT